MLAVEPDVKALFRYRFGSAEFDETRFELKVAGLAVRVERKPLEVLALLLQHAGEVVTKEELLTQLWLGRPTVDHVITNALTKLRDALGEDNAAQIVTQPRVGYRFAGSVERIAVGRTMISRIDLSKGQPVPLRPDFQLESLLGSSKNNEVWLARHLKTNERRVYKFAPDGERLNTLKREVTLFRLLQESLGARDDLVRILDWNFETAPFFLESEFGGENLNEWSKNSSALSLLTQSQRIALFLQVAEVVAAAHDVGVLHKDIKPANVLITVGDNSTYDNPTWKVRLTDFGSGRLLDPQRIQELGITQLGLTMTSAVGSHDQTGTLLYLAPELMNHQAPTVQSDVYALGMTLYQLRVGDLRKPLVSGWEREIEDELLRDDIRAATEGNPAHRLHSVRALIERLGTIEIRHLRLQQERQSLVEVTHTRDALRRAQVRRPWMIAAGALLIAGFATSSWLYVRTLRAQAQTEQQAARANAVTEFLNNDVLDAADPFSGAATQRRTIKEAITNAANNINGKFTHDPMTEVAIRMTLARIFDNEDDKAAAEIQWRRAITVLNSLGPTALPQLLQSRYRLALTLLMQSKFDQAAAELADTDRVRLQYKADDPHTRMIAHHAWGNFFNTLQQYSSAIPHYEQALQLLGAQPVSNILAIDTVRTHLADAYIGTNRLKEAEHLLGDLVDEIKQRSNPNELMLMTATGMYGQSLLYQHRYQAAEPLIEKAYKTTLVRLGVTNYRTIEFLNLRCELYSMTKQLERALQCRQESYNSRRATRGDDHQFTLSALVNVGQSQYALHDYVLAARSLDAARVGLAKTIGIDSPMTQGAAYLFVRSLLQLHQANRAQLLVQGLNAKILEGLEPGVPWTMRLQLLRGMVLLNQGKRSEALPLLQPAAELHDDADPTDTIVQEAQQSLRKVSSTNDDPHLAGVVNESR